MELGTEQRPSAPPYEDAVCKEKLDEQGRKGLSEPLLCLEQLVQNGNPVNEVGTGSGMLTVFHTMFIEDESGKILEKERDFGAEKDEEGGGPYYVDHQPGSFAPEPLSLGGHQLSFATICRHLPTYFGDANPAPPVSESELNHELTDQLVLQGQGEVCSLNITENQTKKNRTLAAGSLKAFSVAPGDMPILEQIQTANQNLNLGHGTYRSARCTAAQSTGQQSSRLSSSQVSRDSQDGTKEKEVPPEPPEELVLPARKKTRTFYSSEQLEELERMFLEDHYPDNEKRREIAAAVGVTPQRVMVWFQNRRAKWRKMEKLTVKGNKKCTVTASSVSAGPQQSSQGAPLLPKPPLPDAVHDQPTTLKMDAATVNCSSMLSGQPTLLASTSVGSVPGRGTPYESNQTKAISQGMFPALSSPPPIRRASLPLSMVINPNSHIIPLMLDTPSSEYSSSSQESSSSEVLTCSSQSKSIGSPVNCSYPEQLEPTANLETPYYHPNNQSGAFQYSQHQAPQLHHFPVHLTGNLLPSVRLTPATPNKSSTAFFSVPGNGGLATYPREGSGVPYLQNHIGGQLLVQPSAGNSGYVPALQAMPWNEFYMQGPPFSNQLCSQMQFSNCGGGSYSAEQTQYAQKQCVTSSSCLLQLPRVTVPGSTVLFTTKQMVPADSNLNPDHHSLEEHMIPSERSSNTDNYPKEEENSDGFSEESKN